VLLSEIDNLCAETAHSTGLPVEWVRHHVDSIAGRPCARCGGSGIVLPGACFRCKGTGGKASHVRVALALEWVRDNIVKVRTLGEKRKKQAPKQESERRLAAETWKKDHAELWDFVDDMLDNEFKRSIVAAIEEARVTENQVTALTRLVEQKKRREAVAPLVGTRVDVRGTVTFARHCADLRGVKVFRVEFDTDEGWRGRVDTANTVIVDQIQARQHDVIIARGTVVWRKDGFAILSDWSELLVDG